MSWIVQVLATDGKRPPEQAVKLEVMRPDDDEPGVQYLRWIEAQCVGAFRVHYGEWSANGAHSRYRHSSETTWRTPADVVNGQVEQQRAAKA